MVKGRMNREPNPVPGEEPAYTAQYFKNNGYAQNVTPDTPFPTTGQIVDSQGNPIGTQSNPLNTKIDDSTPVKTQLTGSNVQEIKISSNITVSKGTITYVSGYDILSSTKAFVIDNLDEGDFEFNIFWRLKKESGSTGGGDGIVHSEKVSGHSKVRSIPISVDQIYTSWVTFSIENKSTKNTLTFDIYAIES